MKKIDLGRKYNMVKRSILLILILMGLSVYSQDTTKTTMTIVNAQGDTLRKTTSAVIVRDSVRKRTPEEEEAYQKLKRKVIKLYPYALLAKQIRDDRDAYINSTESNKEKRKYLKQKEQELRDRFENEIKALYTTDGPVLVKLIYRETGKSTYELLRESKSWVNCIFYQMAAKHNGYSLKDTYDPVIDKDIEGVVQILKTEGQLPVYTK